MIDLNKKLEHLKTALHDKEVEAYYKDLAEKFWLRRSDKLSGKNADDARTTAAAANHEKHVAEEWVEFIKEEIEEITNEIEERELTGGNNKNYH